MSTISQRELRNRSGEVLRAVAGGESFVIANDGVPVARLVPLDGPVSDLPCSRPARTQGGFAGLRRVRRDTPSKVVLDDLRGDR